MKKVLVGLSGGVDSAVAAYLLKEQGYEVVGVTLRTWAPDGEGESRCCEIDDARLIANKLGIQYYALNSEDAFNKCVIDSFVEEYLAGHTPNPCVECNRYVKWDRMLYYAQALEADYVATGHYAYIEKLQNGRYTVKTARHAEKDQTYMLYRLTQEQLARTLMPLGDYSKEQVREIARQKDLVVAEKKDSQEICFVPQGTYGDFIKKYRKDAPVKPGDFVTPDGSIVGRHKGIIHYTIGQRKGLGIALGRPVFVLRIDKDKNQVVVGDESFLFSREVNCKRLNFVGVTELKDGEKLRCFAKIRYHHAPQAATIEKSGKDRVKILFDEPVRAATPGQSAVFYDEDGCVQGGGIII